MATLLATDDELRERHREYQRRYREGHREELRVKAREYHADNRERQRAWHAGNRPKAAVAARARHQANPEIRRSAYLRWSKNNPERARHASRKSRLGSYGMTGADYDAMLEAQGGVCAICSRPPTERPLSVDHDHGCCAGQKSCGQCVRGLVCASCNLGLGAFADDPVRLAAAVLYLSGD